MATLTIRNLDESVKQKLRVRAAQNGRSMEEEVRLMIVRDVGATDKHNIGNNLVDRIRARLEGIGGIDLDIPRRADMPRAAQFDK